MKRKLLLTILIISSISLVPGAFAQGVGALKGTVESLMVDAVQLYTDGDYDKARSMFDVLTGVNAQNDAAFYYKGLCYIYLNDAQKAEENLSEAVRLAPDNYWYKDRLATFYSMTHNYAKTIEIYEALVKEYPKKVDIYYNLVNLYATTNRLDDVIATLDEIEKMVGKDETTTLARYDILMHQDKAEEAFNALALFNEECYASPNILSRMGDAKLAEDADSLALKYYNDALAEDPSYAPALLGKSDVYRFRRSFKEFFSTLMDVTSNKDIPSQIKTQVLSSLTDQLDAHFATTFQTQLDSLYDSGVAAHPSDSSMLKTVASYYYRSDRRDKGNSLFKANADLYPTDFNANATYIQALNYSQDWETLSSASDIAFQRIPDEPAFLSMKAMADYQLGDYYAVIKDNERLLEAFPDNKDIVVEALATIGDTHHMLGNPTLAYKSYEKVLKIKPDYVPVLNNYAYYLSLEGKKLKKAYNMSKVTIEQEPDNSTYLDTFAWILHLQGKDLEAKSFFKHAMLYGGKDSATMLDHYAEVLFALKEYDLAFVYWDQAKKKNTDNDVPGLDAKVEARMKAAGR